MRGVRPGVSLRQMRSHWRLLCLLAQILPQRSDNWRSNSSLEFSGSGSSDGGTNGRRCGGVCCCTGLRGQAGMGGHGCKTEGASVVGTLQWGPMGRSVPTSSEHTCFGGAHELRRSWVLCSRACLSGVSIRPAHLWPLEAPSPCVRERDWWLLALSE